VSSADDVRTAAAAALPLEGGLPLHRVTFAVVDVETTGASPSTAALTEVAAATFLAGECTGTFQTLVCPGIPIPASITALTGITDAMVAGAPAARPAVAQLRAFVDGAVLVGHNVAFDLGFLNAVLAASGGPPLQGTAVDTLALARVLLADEVPDCRLATLARVLRLGHRPAHRAMTDVLATADLLHALIERATGYDVFTLADLLALPQAAAA